MRVLITNTQLVHYSGSEVYVRDVARTLIARGMSPMAYSPRLGKLAEDMRRLSIPVVDDLDNITVPPDLIHGQHHLETMTALARFPNTPAVYFCHGWLPWEEVPPHHPRILHYVVTGELVRESLETEHGIPSDQITLIPNFVDMERFQPRSPLPAAPKRALIFSNAASEANFVPMIREACAQEGIELDVVGLGYGNATATPETLLPNYDLVFARGKAALESMAMGIAVIACDHEGLGGMITTNNQEWILRYNIGLKTLNRPLDRALILDEIRRYDPIDAAAVSAIVRATRGMLASVDAIVNIYENVVAAWSAMDRAEAAFREAPALARYCRWLSQSVLHPLAVDNQELQARFTDLQLERNTLRGQRDEAQHFVGVLQDQQEDLLRQISGLHQDRQTHDAQMRDLEAKLGGIQSSSAWRTVQMYGRTRGRLTRLLRGSVSRVLRARLLRRGWRRGAHS